MSGDRKTEILMKVFSKRFMNETAFDKYIFNSKQCDFGGSVINNIKKQFKNDRAKIEKSMKKAQCVLHVG